MSLPIEQHSGSNDSYSNKPPPRKRARLATHATEQVSVSCSRCKEKKIKCDFDIPMCRPCFKTGSACVIMDTSSGNVYTREQVLSLQKDIDKLQDELRSRGINVREVSRPDSSESWRRPPPNIHSRKTQIRHISKFIGDESGTGFIQHILRAIRRSLKDANFPHSSQEIIFGPTLTEHPAHALPNEADGKKLIDAYLTGFHVQHTFLQRKVVLNLYKTVYQHAPTPMEPSEKQFPQQKKDLFQLNMIFALASIDLHRRNESNKHPFGYFTAALLNLNGILGFETIEDIQGFLLIAQFGLYYYIGCSVWELCQICIRICIELGLHRPPRVASPNLLTEQMRRRVFWECYQLDRISSVALGRPFGIEDSAIEIDTPFDADDEYLEQISYCNQNISTLTQSCSKNGEVAVFNCYIRLRNVAGRIYRALHSNISNDSEPNRKPTPRTLQSQQVPLEAGDAYQLFCEFYSELKSWSLTCPVFQEPSCLAQTPEWFSFLYDREKLTLIQAVIDRVHSRSAFPPKELLNPCHNIAVAIIHKYNDLRKRGQVTYSWSYLQLILSCGLSVIFCVLVKLDHRRKDCAGPDRSWLSNRWTGLDPEAFKDFSIFESSAAIDECTEVHTWMAESSREMGRRPPWTDIKFSTIIHRTF
ncbi:fungal-specific transcription factor domain-containing protein [Bisporella sp. PMI_857]|nr:fungal-specific transcription factor domain-containing protein [Bisporella sp. PMI_857]